ncbi:MULTISPECIES: DUF2375 family protein [Corallincola]|uniref:DUF2375 domain-containing protein n=3 Tax=Corallincola TaxID=1775176 RepID=A0A368NPT5_9GAMM|nr:DUF2375 family protein [Corallincola luteus]RCU51469.1 DUF2375 domain-containing protein [Corallincola holothuriorum]TAA46969.1 DUF2375 domain-containing protein [Corallincola spongiicola]TCI04625.1 DUF2375 domain-containing protein [Corallincola luteus]
MQHDTITVLYYDIQDLQQIRRRCFYNMKDTKGGRVILPEHFRQTSLIVAVLEGDCEVLNTLGERYAQLPPAANF